MGNSSNSSNPMEGGANQSGGGSNGPNGPGDPNQAEHLHKSSKDDSDSESEDVSQWIIELRYKQTEEQCVKLHNYYVKGFYYKKIKLSLSDNPKFVRDYNKYSGKFLKVLNQMKDLNKKSTQDNFYRQEHISIRKSAKNFLNSLPNKYRPITSKEFQKYPKYFRKD